MPVPWEALIPFGLLTTMFAITGTGFSAARRITNGGKPPRYKLDEWEEMMMARDERLTGKFRGQTIAPDAPPEFETNSVWQTEKINY
ncbi:uncharacterized protein L969DRAFT_70285 [Mixia osmundae IAM 14324]|uniref:NADH dehydrogenase [ubiquinone] 1 alpha subcomplex subunit 1 n=1 Tax=Mixia osmundae (strain CBS 9802 / IAM 14324 / JCM 22182 / KY 12970) TaxID=764103 RepID=G7DTF8_MIXOS|nr:uncharacterized protein L969DRAFT_70285 [Mixia osmundae IAM 14324]KEI42857.1 hypothetical protein L969DRAFT_70285 [Mixia osmundae IAM 14324]GAA93805.1 hypothetical protein E5Q_00451 [Mixia osmundae IAM 14324]